jgi:hypothetical protein
LINVFCDPWTRTKLSSLSFKFNKRAELFIGTHDETLSVVTRVCNPDRSPVGINRSNAAPTPSGFAEMVSDDSACWLDKSRRSKRRYILVVEPPLAGVLDDDVGCL